MRDTPSGGGPDMVRYDARHTLIPPGIPVLFTCDGAKAHDCNYLHSLIYYLSLEKYIGFRHISI